MVTFCWLLLHIVSQAFSSALTMQPREFLCSHSQNILDALSMCAVEARHILCWLWLMAFLREETPLMLCARSYVGQEFSEPLNDNLSWNVNCFPIPSTRVLWLKESKADLSLGRGLPRSFNLRLDLTPEVVHLVRFLLCSMNPEIHRTEEKLLIISIHETRNEFVT